MMFLDCPAYLDQQGTLRCGLPAEVRRRYIMRSSDGPLESAMIRCPAGHCSNGPIESLTRERTGMHDPDTAAGASGANRMGSLAGRITAGASVIPRRGAPRQASRRPNTAPAYYLGRPASVWIALSDRRLARVSTHLMAAVTG